MPAGPSTGATDRSRGHGDAPAAVPRA